MFPLFAYFCSRYTPGEHGRERFYSTDVNQEMSVAVAISQEKFGLYL